MKGLLKLFTAMSLVFALGSPVVGQEEVAVDTVESLITELQKIPPAELVARPVELLTVVIEDGKPVEKTHKIFVPPVDRVQSHSYILSSAAYCVGSKLIVFTQTAGGYDSDGVSISRRSPQAWTLITTPMVCSAFLGPLS